MPKCEIQWLDAYGEPTPDTNDAIGIVYCHTTLDPDKPRYICAQHRERAFHYPNWVIKPLPPQAEALERLVYVYRNR